MVVETNFAWTELCASVLVQKSTFQARKFLHQEHCHKLCIKNQHVGCYAYCTHCMDLSGFCVVSCSSLHMYTMHVQYMVQFCLRIVHNCELRQIVYYKYLGGGSFWCLFIQVACRVELTLHVSFYVCVDNYHCRETVFLGGNFFVILYYYRESKDSWSATFVSVLFYISSSLCTSVLTKFTHTRWWALY